MSDEQVQTIKEVVNVFYPDAESEPLEAPTDEAIALVPITPQTLEQALEFIADDELVEVTPATIRVRKRFLTESDRKRASRGPR